MHIGSEALFSKHAEGVLQAMRRAANPGVQDAASPDHPFANLLLQGIGQVNDQELSANAQVGKLLAGDDVSQAEVFTGLQKADMSFRLLIQIRNKLMQAYEELNSIRV